EFSYPQNMKIPCGATVVVSTERGIELGEQVEMTCVDCPNIVTKEQMYNYAQASGGDTYKLNSGRVLRVATEADLSEMHHIENELPQKLGICRSFAEELGLSISVVDCEHVLGGERIVFYFLAEERVDFRELVRRLASEFQTRIEMRQIGARDEARLLADYETCGRECCCKNFLKTLKPISMSMAKLQKTTLDIAKVSGRCGRLKCCLRFEHDHYQDLDKNLPKNGMRIATATEVGRVIDRQILTQLVRIRTDDERIVTIPIEEILKVDVPEGEGAGEEIIDKPLEDEDQLLVAKPHLSESYEDIEEESVEESDDVSESTLVEDEYIDDDGDLSEAEESSEETTDQGDVADDTKSTPGSRRRRRKRRSKSKGRHRRDRTR
ncbi:MAG: hypothetical protein JSV03_15870, partial [Planctomycetota bacterium]